MSEKFVSHPIDTSKESLDVGKWDGDKAKEDLTEIREAAKNRDKNLLALSIEAARRRVTLGEISDALESNFGRYKANIKTISGVYAMNANKMNILKKRWRLLKNLKTKKVVDQELWLPKWDKYRDWETDRKSVV